MQNVSIILPTYNEAGNIKQLIEEIISNLQPLKTDFEIVVVDDNSPDGTAKIVKKISKKDGRINLNVRKNERGLATAVRTGIEKSTGDIILIMDTDFSHPPNVIPRLLEKIKKYDVVVASRYISGGDMHAEAYKYFLSYILNVAISVILSLRIYDSTGGFLAVRRKILKNMDLKRIFIGYGEFCYRLLFFAKNKNTKIVEIPFTYELRRAGVTKTNVLVIGIQYLLGAIRLRIGI